MNCRKMPTLAVASLVVDMQLQSTWPTCSCNSRNGHAIGHPKKVHRCHHFGSAPNTTSYNPYENGSGMDMNCSLVPTLTTIIIVADMQLQSTWPACSCNSGNVHATGTQKMHPHRHPGGTTHKISYNPYENLSSGVDMNCSWVSTLAVASLVADMQLQSTRPTCSCYSGNGHTNSSQKIKNKNESQSSLRRRRHTRQAITHMIMQPGVDMNHSQVPTLAIASLVTNMQLQSVVKPRLGCVVT